MKKVFPLCVFVLFSCAGEKMDMTEVEEGFKEKAKRFHELYITAGDCNERNSMIDKDIVFYENGEPFPFEDIVEYCAYIQPKEVFDVFSQQYFIEPSTGFDYVDQYYINPGQGSLNVPTLDSS